MSNTEKYWENIVFSPSKFLTNPENYLERKGYIAHEENNHEMPNVRYTKQIEKSEIEIIFSSISFHDNKYHEKVRFINFQGPKDLIDKEIKGLELKIENAIQ